MGKTVHITSKYSNLLVSFVIVAEMIICGLLFYVFSSSATINMERQDWLQSLAMICTIYCAVALQNGVGMHQRRSQDYEVLMTVLKNLFYYSVISVAVLHLENFMCSVGLFTFFICVVCLCACWLSDYP